MEHYTTHSIGHHSGMHSGVHSVWQNRKQIHEIKTRRPERFLFKKCFILRLYEYASKIMQFFMQFSEQEKENH